MQVNKFAYRPKSQSVSYKEMHREAGHVVSAFHMHDHEEILLVDTPCTCRLTNNGNSVEIQTPAILINRAGTFHETETVLSGHYHSRVVFFHPQMLQTLPADMRCQRLFESDMLVLPLSGEQLKLFVPLFELLSARPIPQKLLLLLCILSQLEQLLLEGASPVTFKARQSYIFELIEMLQSDTSRFTIQQLAERFHVSQNKLKGDFKQVTGVSVTVFCRQVRLEKAQVLLETTQLEQAQIAEQCGFSDESYFIEIFRKAYGMTPGAYRRSIRIEGKC